MRNGGENILIALVDSGEWEVGCDGYIWRLAIRTGDRHRPGQTIVRPCARRRAETRTRAGYLMVRASIGGRRVYTMAHRLVWRVLVGVIPTGIEINHLNGIKDDNRLANLEICTPSENQIHAYATGLKSQRGERNPFAKLSDADVRAIRESYATGNLTQAQLADRFAVSRGHVSNIVRSKSRAT